MNKIIEQLGSWYAVRLSSFDSLSWQTTIDMLGDTKYIISEEGDGISVKYHQHIIWCLEETTEQIRQRIKKVYPECVGNKCLYIRACRDKKQLAKYTLKEGKYAYNQFNHKYIEEMFKTSKPKTDLKKDVTDNEDEFIMGRITLEEFVENYLNLKAKHDQPIYMNHIESYVRKMMIKKNPKYTTTLASKIIEKIQY